MGYELSISQSDYMVSTDDNDCELGFMQIGVSEKYGPAMLLGELFMRKYFTVFDRGDGSDESARIGFAVATQGANPSALVGKALNSGVGGKEFKRMRDEVSHNEVSIS